VILDYFFDSFSQELVETFIVEAFFVRTQENEFLSVFGAEVDGLVVQLNLLCLVPSIELGFGVCLRLSHMRIGDFVD